jgi:hypothetical protein
MCWATFWVLFLPTHLVTLFATLACLETRQKNWNKSWITTNYILSGSRGAKNQCRTKTPVGDETDATIVE